MCTKCIGNIFWIRGVFVCWSELELNKMLFEDLIFKRAKEREDKKVFTRDFFVKTLKVKVFLFHEECVGILCNKKVLINIETLFYDRPPSDHWLYPGFQLYHLGRVTWNKYGRPAAKISRSREDDKLGEIITNILLGKNKE